MRDEIMITKHMEEEVVMEDHRMKQQMPVLMDKVEKVQVEKVRQVVVMVLQ